MCRRADRGGIAALVLLTLLPAAGRAQSKEQRPRSPQEERRRKLLEGMGLEESGRPAPPTKPQPEPGIPAVPDNGPDAAAPDAPLDKTGGGAGRRLVQSPSFRRTIHPLVVATCKSCHATGAAAGATPLVLSGEAGADHAVIIRVLDLRAPGSSLLLLKASGQKPHGGGAPWPADGPAYERVLAWIRGGARLDGDGAEAIAASSAGVAPMAVLSRSASPVTNPALPNASDRGGTVGASERPVAVVAAGAAVTPGGVDFATRVHPLLMVSCAACHGRGGQAASTRLFLSGVLANDYATVRALVDPASPPRSILIVKAGGLGHGGGPVLPTGSGGQTVLLSWVGEGATGPDAPAIATGSPVPPSSPPLSSIAGAPDASRESHPPAPAPAPSSLRGAPGLALPYGLSINGRFDVAFERANFTGNPFGDAATNGLRSYHHFLFLSRESTDDPFGLSVEMLSLLFWEAHYRWTAPRLPLQVVLAGGKLLVPFGADPLMHQSYGGLSGFDQRILPVIWAQEGVAAHILFHRGTLAVTDDLYLVRGYALTQADGILNLQNDFSPDDHARLGWGNRLGGAWGPFSAWYSAYYNGLGFGRRLFMQAGDVMLWRMRQLPVLGHFSFAAGLLRADISGGDAQGVGGPGKDYYHFGSYFQARYHPTDWLYVQYRQGLRSFNNRRGFVIDDSRLTSDDGSTHNFGVVARSYGLTAGLYYFINLEKVGELSNDLLRVSLSYDF